MEPTMRQLTRIGALARGREAKGLASKPCCEFASALSRGREAKGKWERNLARCKIWRSSRAARGERVDNRRLTWQECGR